MTRFDQLLVQKLELSDSAVPKQCDSSGATKGVNMLNGVRHAKFQSALPISVE